MEATCFSKTLVDFQQTTQHYIAEDRTLHNHRCENPKSYTDIFIFEALTGNLDLPARTEGNHNKLIQDSLCPSKDSNQALLITSQDHYYLNQLAQLVHIKRTSEGGLSRLKK
jgi:hypothetical protein